LKAGRDIREIREEFNEAKGNRRSSKMKLDEAESNYDFK